MNDAELIEHFKIVTELAVNKAFKEHVPLIIAECARRDEAIKLACPAYNLFRRESDVDEYKKMQQSFNKLRRKEMFIFGISITTVNAFIIVIIKKFFS